MKKLFFSALTLAATFFAATNDANAQIALGAQGGLSVPLGTFGDAANVGFGGNLQGSYFVNPKLAVGANFSYYTFGAKNVPSGISASATILGLTPNVQFFFTEEGFRPYVGTDLGYYILGSSVSGGGVSISTSEGYFGIAPHAGFLYSFSSNLALNFNIKYNLVFSGKTETVSGVKVETSNAASLPINIGILYTLGSK